MSWADRLCGRASGLSGALAEIARNALGDANEATGATGDQLSFFIAAIALIAKMAKADGTVGLEELGALDHFIDHDLRCSNETRRLAVRVFVEARDSRHSFKDVAKQVRKLVGDNVALRAVMLEALCRVAAADAILQRDEQELLELCERLFDLPRGTVRHMRRALSGEGDARYAALRLKDGAPADEVERQYRLLVAECEAAARSPSLPPELTELVARRRSAIEEAYRAIKPAVVGS